MHTLKKSELRVVRSILNLTNATRQGLARDTGLSLVKVSSLLAGLESAGHVVKQGKTASRGGRPSFIYRVNPRLGYSIGACVSPTEVRVVVADCSQGLIHEEVAPLALEADPRAHIRSVQQKLSRQVERVRSQVVPDPERVVAVGVALPGMVDTGSGVWLQGLQLTGVTHAQFARELERRLGLPVYIEDVARALAFLEKVRGIGQGTENFVLVYLGLGMGAGIVIGNRLYRGHHGIAGEIGHIVHANNDYRCSCNSVGCLETVVSAPGIIRVFRERLQAGVLSTLQRFQVEEQPLSLEDVLEAARGGDRLAQTTLFEIGQFLGDACAILIKLFNPQKLIVSGEASILKEFFAEPVQQVLQQRVLQEMLQDFQLLFADYLPSHEATGAALVALDHYLNGRLKKAAG